LYSNIANGAGNFDAAYAGEDGFLKGIEFAESWIKVEDELPEKACFLIAKKHNGLELGLSFHSDKFWYGERDQTSQVEFWRPITRS